MTGYNDDSPVIAYTDLFGSEIKIARAALLAPQLRPGTRTTNARVAWSPSPSADYYRVDAIDDCGGALPTNTSFDTDLSQTSFTNDTCVQVRAADPNQLTGDVGPYWQVAPFVKTEVLSDGAGPLDVMDATLVNSRGADVATLGDLVVVLLPLQDEVRLRHSVDGGATFGSCAIASSVGDSRDLDVTTDGSNTYVHVAYEDGSAPTNLIYNRFTYTSGAFSCTTTATDTIQFAASDTGHGVSVFGYDDMVGMAYLAGVNPPASDNNFRNIMFSLKNSHGSVDVTGRDPMRLNGSNGAYGTPVIGGVAPAFNSTGQNVAEAFQIYYRTYVGGGSYQDIEGWRVTTAPSANPPDKVWTKVCSDQPGASTRCLGDPGLGSTFNVELAAGVGSRFLTLATPAAGQGRRLRIGVTSHQILQSPAGSTETAWLTLNLNSKEQVILDKSVDIASDGNGTWVVYSTCSDLGNTVAFKLNLSYCLRNCQAKESWASTVVRNETSSSTNCSSEWFGALGIAYDAADDELAIVYFDDDGDDAAESYQLLSDGRLVELPRDSVDDTN